MKHNPRTVLPQILPLESTAITVQISHFSNTITSIQPSKKTSIAMRNNMLVLVYMFWCVCT